MNLILKAVYLFTFLHETYSYGDGEWFYSDGYSYNWMSDYEVSTSSDMPFSMEETENVTPANLAMAKPAAYDIKGNCSFWADAGKKEIRRQCSKRNSHIVELLHNANVVEFNPICYDWISEMLYFLNYSSSSVEVISTSPILPRLHRTIVQMEPNARPSGIAIDPRRGYLFWTNQNPDKSSVSRANLDGSGVRHLIQSPETTSPFAIAVDYETERIFWTDQNEKHIASCDFDGNDFKVVLKDDNLENSVYSLAIYEDTIYWSDNDNNVFYKAKIKQRHKSPGSTALLTYDDNNNISTLSQDTEYFDARLIAQSIQSGTNACSGSHTCSHWCIGAPNGTYSCLCLEEMRLTSSGQCVCPGSRMPMADGHGQCPPMQKACASDEFECLNHKCVADFKRCDGDDDCGDASDEEMCRPCPPHLFPCKSDGRCIPEPLMGDDRIDCADGSDEVNGTTNNSQDSLILRFDDQLSMLRWAKPPANDTKLLYAVYYGHSMNETRRESKFTTEKREAKLILTPCSKYIVGVSIADATGNSQAPRNWLRVTTQYDGRQPLRNPQKTTNGKTIEFSWEPSCRYRGLWPRPYLFRSHDVTLNRTDVTTLKDPSYIFYNVALGAEYNFSVSYQMDGTEAVYWSHKAPPLPSPEHLHVVFNENGTFTCEWEPIELIDVTFSYELVAAQGTKLNETGPFDIVLTVDQSPLIDSFELLGRSVAATTNFTVGIRIRTAQGYRSVIKSSQLIEIHPLADKEFLSPLICFCIVVISVLIVGLTTYAIYAWTHFRRERYINVPHAIPKVTWRYEENCTVEKNLL